ncbi:MAG: hypothetical protein K1X88_22705 [Nannocystaceae bacterium]|nr:hypothetical protein [Nannocystaceae bacterium]
MSRDDDTREIAQLVVQALLTDAIAAREGDEHARQAFAQLRLRPLELVPDGALRRVRVQVMRRLGTATTSHQARDDARLAWSIDTLTDDSAAIVSPEQCLAAAVAAADAPADATLVEHGWVRDAGQTEYCVRWEHRADGLVIERDRIEVRVNGRSGRVFSVVRRWHAPTERPTPA